MSSFFLCYFNSLSSIIAVQLCMTVGLIHWGRGILPVPIHLKISDSSFPAGIRTQEVPPSWGCGLRVTSLLLPRFFAWLELVFCRGPQIPWLLLQPPWHVQRITLHSSPPHLLVLTSFLLLLPHVDPDSREMTLVLMPIYFVTRIVILCFSSSWAWVTSRGIFFLISIPLTFSDFCECALHVFLLFFLIILTQKSSNGNIVHLVVLFYFIAWLYSFLTFNCFQIFSHLLTFSVHVLSL